MCSAHLLASEATIRAKRKMGRRRAESERSGEAGRVASRPEMGNHNKYASLMRVLSQLNPSNANTTPKPMTQKKKKKQRKKEKSKTEINRKRVG